MLAPLLLLFLFGVAEMSMSFRAANHVSKVVRGSLQEVARHPDNRSADFRALQQISASFDPTGRDRIVSVIVYRTSAADGTPPSSCTSLARSTTSGTTGISGSCNVYSAAYLTTMTAADFADPDCTTSVDRFLCPTTRRTTFAATDRIGIAVRAHHRFITRMIPGDGQTIDDRSVAVLAPKVN